MQHRLAPPTRCAVVGLPLPKPFDCLAGALALRCSSQAVMIPLCPPASAGAPGDQEQRDALPELQGKPCTLCCAVHDVLCTLSSARWAPHAVACLTRYAVLCTLWFAWPWQNAPARFALLCCTEWRTLLAPCTHVLPGAATRAACARLAAGTSSCAGGVPRGV